MPAERDVEFCRNKKAALQAVENVDRFWAENGFSAVSIALSGSIQLFSVYSAFLAHFLHLSLIPQQLSLQTTVDYC